MAEDKSPSLSQAKQFGIFMLTLVFLAPTVAMLQEPFGHLFTLLARHMGTLLASFLEVMAIFMLMMPAWGFAGCVIRKQKVRLFVKFGCLAFAGQLLVLALLHFLIAD